MKRILPSYAYRATQRIAFLCSSHFWNNLICKPKLFFDWFENPIQKIDGFHGTHGTHSNSATDEVSKHSTIIITSYVNASRMFDGYQNLSKVMDQPDGPNPDPDAPLKPLYYAEKDFKFPIRIWLYLSFISRFLRHLSLK